MENQIDLTAASDLDRKFFLAFLKGLASIKYERLLAQVAIENHEPEPDHMDIEFLYSNLFNPNVTTSETFNTLVENCMRVISDLLEKNASKQTMEEYIGLRIVGSEDVKKVIA